MNNAYRNISLLAIFLLCLNLGYPQNSGIDSLKKLLQIQRQDTNKVNLLSEISFVSLGHLPDSSIVYAQQAMVLALIKTPGCRRILADAYASILFIKPLSKKTSTPSIRRYKCFTSNKVIKVCTG